MENVEDFRPNFVRIFGPVFPPWEFTTECGRFKLTFLNIIVNFEVIPNV